MYTLYVNGVEYHTEKNSKLLDYLRDDLRLTSVKNGCGEGACGTCTVLVDGKKTKACVFRLEKLDGKHITTVEGLTASATCMCTPSDRLARCSADSVFRAWSSAPRPCWTKIWTPRPTM